jgi:hypothetical protein
MESPRAGSTTPPPLLSPGVRWFRKVWRQSCAHVNKSRQQLAMCERCKQLRGSRRVDDRDLLLQRHLLLARCARRHLRAALASFKAAATGSGGAPAPTTRAVFSFDKAEAIRIPRHGQETQGMYYMSAMKVGVFGIASEVLRRQWNYLLREGTELGPGHAVVNESLSMVPHFLEHPASPARGYRSLVLYADNTASQNKTMFVMAYYAWRVLTGRQDSIEAAFLVVGHTKFYPDAGFGLLKRCLRNSGDVLTMEDLGEVVDKSSLSNVCVRADSAAMPFSPTGRRFLASSSGASRGCRSTGPSTLACWANNGLGRARCACA